MSFTFQPIPLSLMQAMPFTANLAQAAGTYDLCTVTGGDVVLDLQKFSVYVATAGATLTSVSIQTDQTNPTTLLSAAEGALANLVAQKNLVRATPAVGGLLLKSGQKVRYTIVGLTGSGSLTVTVPFLTITAGASLA